ncbi:hypothetical protein JTB14_022155 [Gonioctena quinquepunctata]|nr:hypothetical protein JTB14_022155 [Gonioctena quinquepunctata]
MTDEEFRARFRLFKETAQLILDELREATSCFENETTAVTAEERLLITLRYSAAILQVQQGFYDISRFPWYIGALECMHIRIKFPVGNNAEIYRNHNVFFPYNVLALCTHDLIIQDIVCRWPMSARESSIFVNYRLRARLQNGNFGDAVIVADSGMV